MTHNGIEGGGLSNRQTGGLSTRPLTEDAAPASLNRQDSTTDQLRDVIVMAESAGCYDAADWIKRGLEAVTRCAKCGLLVRASDLPQHARWHQEKGT